MKITVIGTSNSIAGNRGFITALRQHHEVVNLSAGRNSFYFHINCLLERWDDLCNSDLVLIDHCINDINFYARLLGSEYPKALNQFYTMLGFLNTRVVNLLFPWFPNRKADDPIRDTIISASEAHGICVLDLQKAGFRAEHFSDMMHLNRAASFFFGSVLSRECVKILQTPKPSGGRMDACPFRRVSIADVTHPDCRREFSNSIRTLIYSEIRDPLALPMKPSERVMSLGYLMPKGLGYNQGVVINGSRNSFVRFDTGYYHEVVGDQPDGVCKISPVLGEGKSVPGMAGRRAMKGKFGYPLLVDLLVEDRARRIEGIAATRPKIELDVSDVVPMMDLILPPAPAAATVDKIRDIAIEHEHKQPRLALDLIELAQQFRPVGATIREKSADIRKRLAANRN